MGVPVSIWWPLMTRQQRIAYLTYLLYHHPNAFDHFVQTMLNRYGRII